MCGIGGYITRDGEKPAVTAKQLNEMLLRMEPRGKMATGIFWEDTEVNPVFKLPVPARDFALHMPWKDVIKSPVCLMHTRYATQGNPSRRENNHPLIDKQLGLVLIHNGVIQNSWEFVSNYITDTYSIFEAYSQNIKKTMVGTVKSAIRKLSGTMACALYSNNEKRLCLWKAGSPMAIGFKKNTIFFASTTHILAAVNPNSVFIAPENTLYSIKNRMIRSYKIKPLEGDNGKKWYEYDKDSF